MLNLKLPDQYDTGMSIRETEVAIKLIKDFFERELSEALALTRVSAPLFVSPDSGLNDNLNGIERPVAFLESRNWMTRRWRLSTPWQNGSAWR